MGGSTGKSWIDGFTMMKTPEASNALVDWTKTQPGYENWNGQPIAPTLAEDRKLLTDLNSYAPNPQDSNFSFYGQSGAEQMVPKQTQVAQRDNLLGYINDNPTMGGDQLTPGLNEIKAAYKPALDYQNATVLDNMNQWQDKQLNPGGFWGAMNKLAPIVGGAALSAGVGAAAGGGLAGQAIGSGASQGMFPMGGSGGSEANPLADILRRPATPPTSPVVPRNPMVAAPPRAVTPVPGSRQDMQQQRRYDRGSRGDMSRAFDKAGK